jgi:hypothetical protein
MATFYVVPSRQQLGQRYGEFLTSLFPDVTFTAWNWADLADAIVVQIERHGDAHVIYREDLDEEHSVKDSLLSQFGAALDDEIVEIHFGAGLNQFLHQRWASESVRKAA